MIETMTRPSGANGGAMPLGDDLIREAGPLAEFIFGPPENERQAEADRRAVYHLHGKKELGLFKLGGVLCGRRSTILRHIEELERQTKVRGEVARAVKP